MVLLLLLPTWLAMSLLIPSFHHPLCDMSRFISSTSSSSSSSILFVFLPDFVNTYKMCIYRTYIHKKSQASKRRYTKLRMLDRKEALAKYNHNYLSIRPMPPWMTDALCYCPLMPLSDLEFLYQQPATLLIAISLYVY